jgi:hypothetical protein
LLKVEGLISSGLHLPELHSRARPRIASFSSARTTVAAEFLVCHNFYPTMALARLLSAQFPVEPIKFHQWEIRVAFAINIAANRTHFLSVLPERAAHTSGSHHTRISDISLTKPALDCPG